MLLGVVPQSAGWLQDSRRFHSRYAGKFEGDVSFPGFDVVKTMKTHGLGYLKSYVFVLLIQDHVSSNSPARHSVVAGRKPSAAGLGSKARILQG